MTEKLVKRILLAAFFAIGGFFAVFAMPVHTEAAINPQINFQGKLTNPDGTNVTNGSYSIVFSIYTVASGGAAVWTETQPTVAVADGIFQVSLGSVTSLPGSVDFNSASTYLGVKVGADAEMTPRIQFTAAPYAFNSDRLGGIASSGYVQLSPGAQQTGNINVSGSITGGSSLAFSAASTATIQSAGSQALNITGNAASTLSTSAGQLTLQSGTGTISLGTSTSLTANGALSIVSATTNAVSLDSGTTGAVNVGTGANAKAVTVGNTTAGTTITQRVGTGATAYTIQGAADTFLAIDGTADRIYIGGSTAVATPTVLVLGQKIATGDPAGTNGGMYYNSANNKFRCQQNSSWQDCITRNRVTLAADVINNNGTANTIADVTGLSFPVSANTNYNFSCKIWYTSAATGTGSRWSINGPATTALNYMSEYSLAATTTTRNATNTAYNVPAGTNASSSTTGSNRATIEGFIRPSAGGTVIVRFASEVGGSAITAKAGSSCEYWLP